MSVAGSGSTATLTGADAATTIVGDNFSYTGNAVRVASGDGNSTIVDGAVGAAIVIGSAGRSMVVAGGASQTVHVGENGSALIAATGAGDKIVEYTGSNASILALGDGQTMSIAAQSAASVTSGGNNQTIDVQARRVGQDRHRRHLEHRVERTGGASRRETCGMRHGGMDFGTPTLNRLSKPLRRATPTNR